MGIVGRCGKVGRGIRDVFVFCRFYECFVGWFFLYGFDVCACDDLVVVLFV